LFHSLIEVYYNSGKHSYGDIPMYKFRDKIKYNLGKGIEAYIYVELVNGSPVIKDAKNLEDIPDYIYRDKQRASMIRGRLKSWSTYTKKQRRDTIDNLIKEMLTVQVNSKKFEEILRGINYEIM